MKLTETRTAVDFAHFLRELVENHYSRCEKIMLVMDNLNMHSISSLYRAFEPAIARQIAQRVEIHYTPIHASWLNLAEIEIGFLSRQCLSQALLSFELMARQVNAWVYAEMLLALLSIEGFLPVTPDVNSESFILLYCDFWIGGVLGPNIVFCRGFLAQL